MPYTLTFKLLGLPPSMNARLHWTARARENAKWKGLVWRITRNELPLKSIEKAKVTITFCSTRPRDHDNIVACCKPILDGLVECGILADDKLENIGWPTYQYEKCKRKDAGIRVTVEEVERI